MSITTDHGGELQKPKEQVHHILHLARTTTVRGLTAAATIAEATHGERELVTLHQLQQEAVLLIAAEVPEVPPVLQVHHQVQVVEEEHVEETDQ